MDKIWIETLNRLSELERRVSRIEVPESTEPVKEPDEKPDEGSVQE